MKNHLLFLLGFFLIGIHLHAQTQDPQWLISDNRGKSGYSITTGNVYSVTIGNSFGLNRVSAPNSLNLKAQNDLLVIYRDGSNFHSRDQSIPGPFFRSSSISVGAIHTFTNTNSAPISYMYLSNRYERDDPPDAVKVTNETTGSNMIGVSSTPTISANNNVVPFKDITLILNFDSLTTNSTYTLTYNNIAPYEPRGSPVAFTANVLAPQSVFRLGAGMVAEYPVTGSSSFSTVGAIQINNPGGFRYFNFRPTTVANSYLPDENGIRYEVEFILSDPSGVVATHREALNYSQDPNFLRVDSIHKLVDGHTVFYHLEFENVSSISTNQLSVKVKFPSHFDLAHLQASKWFAGGHLGPDGSPCHGNILLNGDSATFEFINENPLDQCFGNNTEICKGFVEFSVKVKDGFDVMNPNFSLRLDTPRVFFIPSSFPLHEFRDLIRDVDGKHMRLVKDGKGKGNVPRPDTFWERWKCEILIGLGVILLLLLIIFLVRWSRNRP